MPGLIPSYRETVVAGNRPSDALDQILCHRLAKSSPRESIRQHTDALHRELDALLDRQRNLLSAEEEQAVRTAAEVHDYGKVHSAFGQNLLRHATGTAPTHGRKTGDSLPHGTLSPAFLDRRALTKALGAEWAVVTAAAVFYHHDERHPSNAARITACVQDDLRPQLPAGVYLNPACACEAAGFFDGLSVGCWAKYALIKGLLNRLDYAASSASANGQVALDHPPSLTPITAEFRRHEPPKTLFLPRFFDSGTADLFCMKRDDPLPPRRSRCVIALPGRMERLRAACHWLWEEQKPGEIGLWVGPGGAEAFGYTADNPHCGVMGLECFSALAYRYCGCEAAFSLFRRAAVVVEPVGSLSADFLARIVYVMAWVERMGGRSVLLLSPNGPEPAVAAALWDADLQGVSACVPSSFFHRCRNRLDGYESNCPGFFTKAEARATSGFKR